MTKDQKQGTAIAMSVFAGIIATGAILFLYAIVNMIGWGIGF